MVVFPPQNATVTLVLNLEGLVNSENRVQSSSGKKDETLGDNG